MKGANFTRKSLLLLCSMLFISIIGINAQNSNYFPSLEEEEAYRRQQYLEKIQPKFCFTPKTEILSSIKKEENLNNSSSTTSERGLLNTWNVQSGWGASCTNDCVFTPPVSCGTTPSSLFKIPVVFTVSTTTGCGNTVPTEAEMNAQINIMNDFVACQNIPIFYYKCTTYAGHPTTGDLSTRYGNYGCTYSAGSVADLPNVVNIYVFYDTGNGSGCNGFAPLPFSVNSSTRIVMSRNCFNGYVYTPGSVNCSNSNLGLGQVLVHEFGHYLGLYHTHETDIAGNGSTSNDCDDPALTTDDCTKGDGIQDTDEDPDFSGGEIGCTGCIAAAQSNCSFNNSSPACAPYGTPNTIDNIMSYNIYAGCIKKFSTCQKAKMMDALTCVRGLQVCCRDINAEFALGSSGANLEICTGQPAPTFTATSNCYKWYSALGASAVALASNTSTFTPTIGTGAGQLNNLVPGIYTWYLGDLNETNPNCRTTLTITVRTQPGTPTVNGSSSVSLGCTPTSLNFTTSVTAVATDEIVGWWFTSTPLNITSQTNLDALVNTATINGTLSAPMNHIYESTSGSPLKNLTKTVDCSILSNGTHKVYPIIARKRALVPDASCSPVGSVGNTTFNGFSGKVSNITPALVTCRPASPPNSPTYNLVLNVSGFTGTSLGVAIRNTSGGAFMYTNFSAMSNGTLTLTQANFPTGYDPGVTGNGFQIFVWEQGSNLAGTITFSSTLNITYPGLPAIPFPSPIYSNCHLGTPLDVVCGCAPCTPPTISTQPTPNQTICSSQTATLSVTATGGTAPYTYQWKKGATNVSNGASISGATTATLTINPATLADAGTYTCVITDAVSCSVTSNNAVLNVNPAPTFTAAGTNPTSCSANNGSIALNGLTASTSYSVSYTANGTPVAAANFTSNASGVITISSLAPGAFTNIIVSLASCPSAAATVNLTAPSAPTAAVLAGTNTICNGSSSNLTVTITGGTSPYTVVYSNGANQTVNGYTSGTNISVSPTVNTTYSLVSVTDANGCAGSGLSGTPTVTVVNLPTVFNVTGGGSYCSGGTGVAVGLSGSQTGVNYQLKNGAANVGTAVAGTGAAISFGNQTTATTYTVVATTTTGSCSSTMTGSAVVSINPTPTFTAAGTNPTSCFSNNGSIALSGLTASTSYSVSYTANGTPVAAANFTSNASGVITISSLAPGAYTNIIVSLASCPSAAATVNLTAPSAPTAAVLAGTNTICNGNSSNLTVTITGGTSPYTVVYSNGANQTVNGYTSGTNISVSPSVNTTYSLVSVTDANGCAGSGLSGTPTVTVVNLPTVFNVTGGGSYCSGGTGVAVGLSGSQTGVNYQLKNGATNVGAAVAGTGAAISFGNQTTATTYTVVATTTTGSCSSTMTGSAVVSINPTPTFTAAGTNPTSCSSNNGSIALSGLTATTTYSVSYTANGTPVAAANFTSNASGVITISSLAPGAYTNIIVSLASCPSAAATVNLTAPSAPTSAVLAGTNTICNSSSSNLTVTITGGTSPYTVVYSNGANQTVNSYVSGANISVSPTVNTTYSLVSVTDANGCAGSVLSGTPIVTVVNLPTVFNVTGGGSYCSGGTGVAIGLSSSQTGVNYQLKNGATNVGAAIAGTGAAISFGNQTTATTYTVVATTTTGSCSSTMNGSVVVSINPTPTFSVSGTNPTSCSSNNGSIALSGLTASTSYSVSYTANGTPMAAANFTSNASGVITISSLAPGAYTNIIVSLASCPSAAAIVNLTAPSAPTAAVLAGTNTICNGNSSNLTVTITGGTSPYTVVYSNGANQTVNSYVSGTNISVSPTVNTTYSLVSVTDANGCAGSGLSGTPTVTVNNPPSTSAAGLDQTICFGSNATLAANVPVNGTGLWSVISGPNLASSQFASTSTNNTTFTPTASGAYTLRWTISSTSPCTPSTDDIVINVNSATTVANAGADFSLCVGNGGNLAGNTATVGTGSWSIQSGPNTSTAQLSSISSPTATFTPTLAGTYTLRWAIAGTAPCTNTFDDVVVTVNSSATVNAITNVTACAGQSVSTITISGTAGATFNWSNNNTLTGLVVSGTGNIASFTAASVTTAQVSTVTVTPVLSGCTGVPTTFTITVNPTPSVNAVSNVTACSGKAVAAITFAGTAGATFNWTSNNTTTGVSASGTNSVPAFTAATTSSVVTSNITVTPVLGTCTGSTKTFTITVNPNPTATLNANPTLVCPGTPAILAASGGTTYNWGAVSTSTGATITVSPVANTTYTVTATDANSCSATATTTVNTKPINDPTCAPPAINNNGTFVSGVKNPLIIDPCTCLGGNLFNEDVVIKSLPGQTWTVMNVPGNISTLLNPATLLPFANGTPFTELAGIVNGLGQVEYKLNGRHYSGVGYTIYAQSPTYPGLILTFSNLCTTSTASGPMTCADNMFISLPATCTTTITPSMILTSPMTNPANYSTVVMNGTSVISNTMTSANIGKTYNVKVVESCTGNSCWGTFKLEDKAAPTLTCPANVTVKCSDNISENIAGTFTSGQVFGPLTAPTVSDCSKMTLTYSDNISDFPCGVGSYITKKVIRNYKAIDEYGNVAECSQVIDFIRPDLTGATLSIAKKSFDCAATFTKDANGNPHPSESGYPTVNAGLNNIQLSAICDLAYVYTDVKTNACGNGYEIARKWFVTDNCSQLVFTVDQIIEVKDITKPTFTGTFNEFTISTSAKDCLSDAQLNVPSAKDNCDNNLVYSLQATLFGTSNSFGFTPSNGKVNIKGLAVGKYNLVWKITDNCGNFEFSPIQVMNVADLVAPTAVCDLNTKVALTQQCNATVDAITFDDGSLDNCCLDINRFEVARMGITTFKPSIEFNKADCAAPVMVQLRVWDCNGNSNVCMVNVTVEDKIAPVAFGRDTIVCCGSTPSASAWLNNYQLPLKTLIDFPSASNPGYFDNCGATATKTQNGTIDNCGNGTVTHVYTVKDDKNGMTATTNVRFISENRSAYMVEFPDDASLTCNSNKVYATDPASTGSPIITNANGTCPLVGVEYTDEVLTVVPDACFKIIRTWKILNWCQPLNLDPDTGASLLNDPTNKRGDKRKFYNIDVLRPDRINGVFATDAPCNAMMSAIAASYPVGFDNDGYMEYKQIIKVVDNTMPDLSAGNVKLEAIAKDCRTKVTIEKPNSSDCTGVTAESYQLIAANNTVVSSGTTFPAIINFGGTNGPAFGNYVVRYRATDKCGNYATTDVTIEVKDIKKPTPVCYYGLAVDLMPTTGNVMLNCNAFDAGSYDNCSPFECFVQTGTSGPNAASPNSSDVDATANGMTSNATPNKVAKNVLFDCVGLQAVRLWVKDAAGNWDYCDTYIDIQNNMNAQNVPSCTTQPTGTLVSAKVVSTLGNPAKAEVSVLATGYASPIKKWTSALGVTSGAIVSLGSDAEVSAENNTNPLNGVSTLDLVLISKHILGTQLINSKYALIAADVNKNNSISTADLVELRKMILGIQATFSNNKSWRFYDANMNEVSKLTNIQSDALVNFTGVKIGDVNGNADATLSKNRSSVAFEVKDATLKVGQEHEFTINNKEVEGFQFALNYDSKALEVVELDQNSALFENGVITTAQVASDFKVKFRAKKNVQLSSAISLGNSILNETVVNETSNLAVLSFNQEKNALELYQNRPNPFREETLISFNLPQTGEAQMTITDVNGKVVKNTTQSFTKGYNEVKVTKQDLGASGVFFYQLEQNGEKAVRKLIILE